MNRQDAEALLDLIVERADGLRKAGIRSVNLGGASFTLAAPELELEDGDEPADDGPRDALHDPWAHGIPGPGTPASLPPRRRPPL